MSFCLSVFTAFFPLLFEFQFPVILYSFFLKPEAILRSVSNSFLILINCCSVLGIGLEVMRNLAFRGAKIYMAVPDVDNAKVLRGII